jgi:hypothetical protein
MKVYSRVAANKSAEVVNLLLDMHVLEDEQQWLRQRIQVIYSLLLLL